MNIDEKFGDEKSFIFGAPNFRAFRVDTERPDYSFDRNMLITSSEVITPTNFLSLFTTGRVSRLYLSNNSATSISPVCSSQEIRGSWEREINCSSGLPSTS